MEGKEGELPDILPADDGPARPKAGKRNAEPGPPGAAGAEPSGNVPSREAEEAPEGGPPGFLAALKDSFAYPFHGDGKYTIVAGVAVYFLIYFLATVLSGFIVVFRLFLDAYLVLFAFKIVHECAVGRDEVPDWPDFADFFDEFLLPFVYFGAALLISFAAPAILLASGSGLQSPFFLFSLLLGCFYLPMQVLAYAVTRSFMGSNPYVVLRGVAATLGDYLGLFAAFALAWAAAILSLLMMYSPVPAAGWFTFHFALVYFTLVFSRLLGAFYRRNRTVLRFLEER